MGTHLGFKKFYGMMLRDTLFHDFDCLQLQFVYLGPQTHLNDLARHGPHVGASVALNFRHVSHAPNTEPEVLQEKSEKMVATVSEKTQML